MHSLRTFGDVVVHYIQHYREPARHELDFFRCQSSLVRAVHLAALAQGENGKLRHQWRVAPQALERWAKTLHRDLAEVRRCRDFESLLRRLEAVRVSAIGELTIYDTGLRIGAKLGLEPTTVYLHRGTRMGARALGFDGRRRSIRPGELPQPFRRLRPYEMEDCLCIYSDALARVAAQTEWRPD
jgi:hypothetical protein